MEKQVTVKVLTHLSLLPRVTTVSIHLGILFLSRLANRCVPEGRRVQ